MIGDSVFYLYKCRRFTGFGDCHELCTRRQGGGGLLYYGCDVFVIGGRKILFMNSSLLVPPVRIILLRAVSACVLRTLVIKSTSAGMMIAQKPRTPRALLWHSCARNLTIADKLTPFLNTGSTHITCPNTTTIIEMGQSFFRSSLYILWRGT